MLNFFIITRIIIIIIIIVRVTGFNRTRNSTDVGARIECNMTECIIKQA